MKKKLNYVLLVDDDDDCNFFHQRLLNKMECTEKIEIAHDGQKALDFLNSSINGLHPKPDIIFLDINMPGMGGWEFLEEYTKLDEEFKEKIVLVMLTSSLNPDDKERALSYSSVNGFINKYLDKESLNKILTEHFLECF
ncbi:MAG TPA: response regulator [Hanamia sp.]